MEYLYDIFYKIRKLTKKEIRELFSEAKDLSFNWWIDDLPTIQRRKIDMSFDDILKVFDKTPKKNLHIVFIHRRGYENWNHYLEIGLCTLNRKSPNGDLFLFINVEMKYKQYFLDKYFSKIKGYPNNITLN